MLLIHLIYLEFLCYHKHIQVAFLLKIFYFSVALFKFVASLTPFFFILLPNLIIHRRVYHISFAFFILLESNPFAQLIHIFVFLILYSVLSFFIDLHYFLVLCSSFANDQGPQNQASIFLISFIFSNKDLKFAY